MVLKKDEKPEAYRLSVVIATLGGDVLNETIASLNTGKIIPKEILVCIPEEESDTLIKLPFNNITVIRTPCRGQVAQRACGLRRAKQSLVLQMDDDIVFQPGGLEKLIKSLDELGAKNVISPVFQNISTGQYLARFHQGIGGWFKNIIETFICGAPWGTRRMGVISPAGIGYGVDITHCGPEPVETQWIPGGCVLCRREDLIIEDYYPFDGKAYSEDLIHSILWRNKGMRLYIIPSVSCLTYVTAMHFSYYSIRADMKAHSYIVQLINGKVWRLRLWYYLYVLKSVVLTGAKYITSARRSN